MFKKLFISALLVFPTLSSASELILGDGVQVLVLNGKNAPYATLGQATPKIKLVDGENQILAVYQAEFKKRDAEVVTSYTYLLNFSVDGQNVHIEGPKITKERHMAAFNQTGNWMLTSSGKEIAYKKQLIKKDGMQIGRDFEREVEDYNFGPGDLAMPEWYVNSSVSRKHRALGSVNGSAADAYNGKNLAIANLKYWFAVASEKEKAEFYKWLSTQ